MVLQSHHNYHIYCRSRKSVPQTAKDVIEKEMCHFISLNFEIVTLSRLFLKLKLLKKIKLQT